MPDHCRTCRARIRWATTTGGVPIPLDHEPSATGNLRLDEHGRASVVPAVDRDLYAGELYTTHFATCPYAEEHWRR